MAGFPHHRAKNADGNHFHDGPDRGAAHGHGHDHGHDHGHGHSHGPGAYRGADRRALTLAALLTTTFMVAEVVGGLLTGSLALLADAGHMLSDSFSLLLALGAVWLAARPATARRTFGFKRAEILAALVNGMTLVLIAAWIVYEAIGRLGDPPEIESGGMLVVALLGLLVNVVAAFILSRAEGDSLNVSAAFRHVLADLLGSVGVIAAALIILATGWELADPLISLVIALLIAASAWSILRESTEILLEAAPRDLDTEEIGQAMAAMPDVVEVHDLHVWTITSGFPALSAHVVVAADADCHARRWEIERMLHDRFNLDHTTLQMDHAPTSFIPLDPP
jgi:cobalt-zinc-cadmium efflux system protein